jgi:cytoskeletal protein CcmA (bactofilin family)
MAVFGKKKREQPQQSYQHVKKIINETKTTTSPSANHSSLPGLKNSVIGKTILIKGNIFSDEEVFIEGKIEGKLHIQNRVVVEKSGLVNADIEAREVVIKGTVNGNVKGSSKVEIIPAGVLNGNIISPGVVLREGAVFKGSIDMTVKEE